MLLLVGTCAVAYVTRPKRLAGIVASGIESATGAVCTIDSAHMGWSGGLSLVGVELRVPGVAGDAGRLFEADQAEVRVGLTRSGWDVRSLTLVQPEVWLTEDLDEGGFMFERLVGAGQAAALPESLPDVAVTDGVLIRGQIEGGVYQTLGQMQLQGSLLTETGNDQSYGFTLLNPKGATGHEGQTDTVLSGRIDLKAMRLEASLYGFAYDEALRELLPLGLRAWDAAYEPRGRVQRFDVFYGWDEERGLEFGAEVTLDEGEVVLPYDDQSVLMSEVAGTFTVSPEGVEVHGLVGHVAGVRYRVDGSYDGFDGRSPFELRVKTDRFELPEEIEELFVLPRVPAIRELYDGLKPQGRFQTEVRLVREVLDGPVVSEGEVELLGAGIEYHGFPYPLSSMTGRVTFTNDRVELLDCRGLGPTGAVVEVSGEIMPPGDEAEVRLWVRCQSLPLDEALLLAVDPETREIIQSFTDEELWASAAASLPDGVDTSAYAPLGSRVGVEVEVYRPYGWFQPYRNTVRVFVGGARGVMQAWPYPMRALGGVVEVVDNEAALRGIQVEGPTGMTAVVDGAIRSGRGVNAPVVDAAMRMLVPGPSQQARFEPTTGSAALDVALGALVPVRAREVVGEATGPAVVVRVSDVVLPLDGVLVSSLPAPENEWLVRLGLEGALEGGAVLLQEADGALNFEVDASWRAGRAQPFTSPWAMEPVQGRVLVRRGEVGVRELVAGFEEATLAGDVWVKLRDPVDLSVHLVAQNLPLNSGLLGLLPEEASISDETLAWVDDYALDGRADAAVTVMQGGAGDTAGLRYQVELMPRWLSGEREGVAWTLEDGTGRLTFDTDGIAMTRLGGRLQAGWFELTGLVEPSDRGLGFSVSASGSLDTRSEVVRVMMPAEVRETLDTIAFAGTASTEAFRMVWLPGRAAEGGDVLEAEGELLLSDAAIDLGGVVVDELSGQVGIDLADQDGVFEFEGWLSDVDARVLDRRVTDLGAVVANPADGSRMLVFQDVRGELYGGVLLGEAVVGLQADELYSVSLTLDRAEYAPMVEPGGFRERVGEASVWDRDREQGLISATVAVTGRLGDSDSRRGRATMMVEEARLFERPWALAMMTAANFAVPARSAFDQAEADMHIIGDVLGFDYLALQAPNVAIAGSGTMSLNGEDLALVMFTRNPSELNIPGVTALSGAFRDEIIRIEVSGTLNEPTTRVRPLSSVFGAIGRIFGLGGAEKNPEPIRPNR